MRKRGVTKRVMGTEYLELPGGRVAYEMAGPADGLTFLAGA
jgi:hypothetical protein